MRTKNYAMKTALKMQKQINTVSADLYGGANDVVPGTGNLKYFDECVINDPAEKIVDTAINGTQADNFQETVSVIPSVEVSASVHTAGDNDIIVSTIGFEALDGPKSHASGKYTHLILLQERGKEQREFSTAEQALIGATFDADDRYNCYCHIAQDQGPSTLNAKNVVFKGFEFSSQQKQELKCKFTGTAESVNRATPSGQTSGWTKNSGTLESTFKHYQGALSVGVEGQSLASIQCLEFAVKGNFGLTEGVIPTGTSNGGLAQAEPLSDGKTEITVDFRIYKHDTDVFKTYELVDTFLSAKMEYTKGDNFLGFYFPRLQVVSATPEFGEGGSILVSCRAFLPIGADPFTTERTVNATEWALPFSTRMYLISKDASSTNWLRAV